MSTRYEILRQYKYRDADTLLVSNKKEVPWRSIPYRLHVWFLVFYHWNNQYNIEVRTTFNDERMTLGQLIKMLHEEFISKMNRSFASDSERKYRLKEAIHLVALQPEAAPTKRQILREARLEEWSHTLRKKALRASHDSTVNRKKMERYQQRKDAERRSREEDA